MHCIESASEPTHAHMNMEYTSATHTITFLIRTMQQQPTCDMQHGKQRRDRHDKRLIHMTHDTDTSYPRTHPSHHALTAVLADTIRPELLRNTMRGSGMEGHGTSAYI